MLWITIAIFLGAAALLVVSVQLKPRSKAAATPAHHQCALPVPPQDLHLVRLRGDGDYGLEVAGLNEFQKVLERLCGGRCEAGHYRKTVAMLVPDERTTAVAVMIEGERVGHLFPDAVAAYQAETTRRGWRGLSAICDALIVDGWERMHWGKLARGDFRVKLDISWPLAGQVNEYRWVA